MPKLIIKRNTESDRVIELDKSKSVYVVGSDEDNDIVINDDAIAATQLQIERRNTDFYIEPVRISPSILLNGRPLRYRLHFGHGDQLVIGQHTVLLDNHEYRPGRTTPGFEMIDDDQHAGVYDYQSSGHAQQKAKTPDTATIERESGKAESAASEVYEIETLSEESDAAAEPQPETPESADGNKESAYCLVAIYGPYIGKKYPLKLGDTRIGRDNTLNDIVIRNNQQGALDPSVSRRHATISYNNGKFYVSDKRSKTRTYVNQAKLSPEDEYPVYEGDEIEIVSDQKSTIFRLASRANPDLKPPRKAGTWWVRHGLRAVMVAGAACGLMALVAAGLSCQNKLAQSSKPDKLKLFEQSWYQVEVGHANAVQTPEAALEHAAIGAADLNGDGKVNIVFADKSGRLNVLDGATKETIWQNERPRVLQHIPLVLADLNNNNLADVLTLGVDGRLYALDGVNGAEIWISPMLGDRVAGPPAVNDFNQDKLLDVAICTIDGQIHIGYGDVFRVNWKTIETGLTIHAVPAAIDWNKDGAAEIIVGSEEGKLVVVDGKSASILTMHDFNQAAGDAANQPAKGHAIRYPVAMADLDNNDSIDLIVASVHGDYLALESGSMRLLWHEKLHNAFNFINETLAPVTAELNNDNITDAALVSNRAIKVIRGMHNSQAKKQLLWENFADGDDFFITPPAMADFSKDGNDEIILGTIGGSVLILDGASGGITAQIHNEANPAASAILACDLEGNGRLDLVYRRKDGNLYAIQSNAPVTRNHIIWGQAYNDARHAGTATYAPPASTVYNAAAATFGVLFMLCATGLYAADASRKKQIQHNRSSA